jgi:hypothetical protein
MVVKMSNVTFLVVKMCSRAGGYQRFRGTLKEAMRSSETLVNYLQDDVAA